MISLRFARTVAACGSVRFGFWAGIGGESEPAIGDVPVLDVACGVGAGASFEAAHDGGEERRSSDAAAEVTEAAGEGIAADDDAVDAKHGVGTAQGSVHHETHVADATPAFAVVVVDLAGHEVTDPHRGGFPGCGR